MAGGGRSIYFRDPAGNCLEFAEPRIWKLDMTRRLQRGTRLVVASHNPGKVREIDELVRRTGSAVSAAELGLPEPEETGSTFVANAELKALAAAKASGLPALADDFGLEVEALGGAPGIYSARWAGPAKDFALAMQRVARRAAASAAAGDRRGRAPTSRPRSAWPGPTGSPRPSRAKFTAIWFGRRAATKGFGYDPMFVPDGETLTFGEMEPTPSMRSAPRPRLRSASSQPASMPTRG